MEQTHTKSQLNFFDLFNIDQQESIVKISTISIDNHMCCLDMDLNRYNNYDVTKYQNDINQIGLKQTWQNIIHYVLNNETKNEFLHWNNFAELYEIGLALQDKQAKKESGQYYTPDDVALVMSDWFNSQVGDNICDVACGTGKLSLTYLDLIGK